MPRVHCFSVMAMRPRLMRRSTWAIRLAAEEVKVRCAESHLERKEADLKAGHYEQNVWRPDRARWSRGPQGKVRAVSVEEAREILAVNMHGLTVVFTASDLTAESCPNVVQVLKGPILDFPGVPCVGLPREMVPDAHPGGRGWGIVGGFRTNGDGTLYAYFVKAGKAVKAMRNPNEKDFRRELARQFEERQLAALLGLSEVPGGEALVHGIADTKAQQTELAKAVLSIRSTLPSDAPGWRVDVALTNTVARMREGWRG